MNFRPKLIQCARYACIANRIENVTHKLNTMERNSNVARFLFSLKFRNRVNVRVLYGVPYTVNVACEGKKKTTDNELDKNVFTELSLIFLVRISTNEQLICSRLNLIHILIHDSMQMKKRNASPTLRISEYEAFAYDFLVCVSSWKHVRTGHNHLMFVLMCDYRCVVWVGRTNNSMKSYSLWMYCSLLLSCAKSIAFFFLILISFVTSYERCVNWPLANQMK